MYERALAVQEKALGKDHPDTAATRKNIAFIKKKMKKKKGVAHVFTPPTQDEIDSAGRVGDELIALELAEKNKKGKANAISHQKKKKGR